MKKIILALTIIAFAVAVQAGEGKSCCQDKAACANQDKAACASQDKAACAAKAMSGCPFKSGTSAKATCPKAQAAKKSVMSPKAASEVTAAN